MTGAPAWRLLLASALALASPAPAWAAELPDADSVRAWLAPLVDDAWVMGLVVGLAEGDDVRVTGFGRLSAADDRVPGGDTLYEIGAVTKVLTATLLAEAVARGELALDDAVAHRLPPGVALAGEVEGWRPVTLADLATHHSGLPRLPDDFAPVEPGDPYADYTVRRLYDWLSGYELTVPPQVAYGDSDLGAGLLGHVLSLSAGTSYEVLLEQRLAGPLGLGDTVVTLDRDQLERFAPPYDADLRPVAHWHFDALVGAGGMRSTVDDLLAFTRACLGRTDADPAQALAIASATAMVPRRPGHRPDVQMGLGWHVDTTRGVWFHTGRTGGYHAYVAVMPEGDRSIVVLGNTASSLVSDVGEGLLQFMSGREPEPLDLPRLAELDDETLEARVGRYAFASLPTLGVRVTRDERGLLAQVNEPRPLRIYPRDARHFDYRVVKARIEFVEGEDGSVDALVLHQFGRVLEARRIP